MTGYFTRLIGQTGINVGTGTPAAPGTTGRETPRPIHLEEVRPVEPQPHEVPKNYSRSMGVNVHGPGSREENHEYFNTEGMEGESPKKREKNQGNHRDGSREKDSFHREEPGRQDPGQAAVREIGLETIRPPRQPIAPLEGRLNAGDGPAPLDWEATAPDQPFDPHQRVDQDPGGQPGAETKAWSSTLTEVRKWIAGGEAPGKKAFFQDRDVKGNTPDEKSRVFQGASPSRWQSPEASGQRLGTPAQNHGESAKSVGGAAQGPGEIAQSAAKNRQSPGSPRQTAEPGVTDYHLSIGTISLIVEGPKEDTIGQKPRAEAVKGGPGSEGKGSRLSRHYIRI